MRTLPMELVGTVVAGKGEGAGYVRRYNRSFAEQLGFEPFPGTLNLRLATVPAMANALVIQPPEQGLFPVECFSVVINNKVRGALVRPVRTAHPREVLEVIAPLNLRKYLGLKDGDTVTLRL